MCVCFIFKDRQPRYVWTLRKKILTKKGSGWLNGVKFKTLSLPAMSIQGTLIPISLQREACTKLPASCTELLAGTVFLPSEPALINEFLGSYFNQ